MILALCFGLLVLPKTGMGSADTGLAVLEGGVQNAEDSPFVQPDFQFLPGDYIYFTFSIAGFAIYSEGPEKGRKISLSYEVEAEDLNRVPLAAPASDKIDAEINPEDKNWTPKRRISLLLPSYLAAGRFQIHVAVKDSFGKTETARDFPFQVGGVQVQPSSSVATEQFGFLRKENDRELLETPAFAQGDTVFARFEIVGFKTGKDHQHHLSYGFAVFRPDGKILVNDAKAAELDGTSFYPAQYLPGSAEFKLPSNAPRGQYLIALTLHDLIGNTTSQIKRAFSVE